MDYSGTHNDLLDEAAAHPLLAGLRVPAGGVSTPLLLPDISEQAWPFLGAWAARHPGKGRRVWFVCRNVRAQEEFASELSSWIAQTALFPDLEIPSAGLGLPDPEMAAERLAVLGRIARGECVAPVITAGQWEERVPSAGDLTGDLASKRGQVTGTQPRGLASVGISALVPLAELDEYQSRLKSLTGGQGSYSIAFSHYAQVPPAVQQKLALAHRSTVTEDD